jgi:itaconate CoA-transferase
MSGQGALSGLLVVTLEQAVAAPLCSCRLADAGARVIKIERPEGDFARGYDRLAAGQSSYFVWLNRGKESIALDLKAEADLAVLRAMLAHADVFIQNLATGAADRLGLDDAALAGLNPRLIRCNISGYGPTGPFRDRKAYDLLVQAESGLASVTGTAEAPARVGVSVCDIATGMSAHAAILEALIARGVTGAGRRLDIAMFDTMADWMAVPLLQAEGSGRNPPRIGLHHASIAPYGAYRCADGAEVLLSIQNEREWRAFCADVLVEADMAADPRFAGPSERVANRAALDVRIGATFGGLPAEAVIGRLDAARIAYARVNTALDLAGHAALRRMAVATPAGPVSVPMPPARAADAPEPGAVPALDAQGAALRREFAPR